MQKTCTGKKIRFAGILDESSKLVADGFKEGLIPLEGDKQKLTKFMEFISEISLR